ncbi:MAG: hypothetical protein JNG89_10580 [Planctomycetaceae bacterium]|nr:hypothetical protein [Planctomycetaceae bacterium]
MPDSNPDPNAQRLIRRLGDVAALRDQGVDDQWIARCAELVTEWQALERRFKELEASLSRSEDQGGQDTIVF